MQSSVIGSVYLFVDIIQTKLPNRVPHTRNGREKPPYSYNRPKTSIVTNNRIKKGRWREEASHRARVAS